MQGDAIFTHSMFSIWRQNLFVLVFICFGIAYALVALQDLRSTIRDFKVKKGQNYREHMRVSLFCLVFCILMCVALILSVLNIIGLHSFELKQSQIAYIQITYSEFDSEMRNQKQCVSIVTDQKDIARVITALGCAKTDRAIPQRRAKSKRYIMDFYTDNQQADATIEMSVGPSTETNLFVVYGHRAMVSKSDWYKSDDLKELLDEISPCH